MANVVFMGTPDFAVPSLDRIVEGGYSPVAVVTQPDRRRGRGRQVSPTPVREAAERHGIDRILQPESVKDPGFAEAVALLEPDVIVVVAFSILPPAVFQTARLGAFNLHASLLPRYRGAAPIHRAIMAGETQTGVTTFFLKEKVDTGNIIMQRPTSIGSDETTGDVLDRMKDLGADVVFETLLRILEDRVETSIQDDSLATPAPKIYRDDCRVHWDSDRKTLHNFIRGLSPFPGAWTHHGQTELKLFRSRLPEDQFSDGDPIPMNNPPGTVLRSDDRLLIAATDGHVELLELQQEGRKRLSAGEFLRGYTIHPGDVLS